VVALLAAPAASAVQFTNGNVFAGVGRGEIREFTPSGTLVQTLDTETGSFEQNGMCFDSDDNLYATSIGIDTMTKFGTSGNILRNPFGSGFDGPASCVIDATGDVYVGQASIRDDDVLKFSSSGTFLGRDLAASPFQVPGRLALAADQCTLFYVAYRLVGGAIRRNDVCTNTQLADFTTELPSPCADLEIRPNGEVMVACDTAVHRFDPAGAAMQTYPLVSDDLLTLSLDPDGTSFWTATHGGGVFRVDISSGDVLTTFNANPRTFMSGLQVLGEPPPGQPIGPEFGEIGIIDPISGTCSLKEPGESSVGVTDRTAADFGSRLNVSKCVADLITALPSGQAQEARFFGQAAFKITQLKRFTSLKLVGNFFPVTAGASAAGANAVTSGRLRRKCRKAAFRATHRKKCRRVLWGSGSGSYSTSGSYSSGSLRGTKWRTVDFVDKTITFVKRGRVRVFDCSKKKKVLLKKGDKYVAKKNPNAKRGGHCRRKR
jgi:hypothetical protein